MGEAGRQSPVSARVPYCNARRVPHGPRMRSAQLTPPADSMDLSLPNMASQAGDATGAGRVEYVGAQSHRRGPRHMVRDSPRGGVTCQDALRTHICTERPICHPGPRRAAPP